MVYIYHLKQAELVCTLYYLIAYKNENIDSIKNYTELLKEAELLLKTNSYISDFNGIKLEINFKDYNYLDGTNFDKEYGFGLTEYAATLLRISTLENIHKNILDVIKWYQAKDEYIKKIPSKKIIKPEDLNYLYHWQDLPNKLITNCVIINADIFHMVLYNPENDYVYCFTSAMYNPMLDYGYYVKDYGSSSDELEIYSIASLSTMNNETKVIRLYINEKESSYTPDCTFMITETDNEVLNIKRNFDNNSNHNSVLIKYYNHPFADYLMKNNIRSKNDQLFKDFFYGDTLIDNKRHNPYTFSNYPTNNGQKEKKYYYSEKNQELTHKPFPYNLNKIHTSLIIFDGFSINGDYYLNEEKFSYRLSKWNEITKIWDYYYINMHKTTNEIFYIEYKANKKSIEFDVKAKELIPILRELFNDNPCINALCNELEDNEKTYANQGKTHSLAQKLSLMNEEDMEKLALASDTLLTETRSYFEQKSGLDLSNNEYTKNRHIM